MNKKYVYGILSVILIIGTIIIGFIKYNSFSEAKEEEKTLLSFHNEVQQLWQKKTLKYPDSLKELNYDLYIKNHLKSLKKDYLIVSYLDADCSDCVSELREWDAFLNDTKIKDKADVVFIAISSGIEMFKYQVNDQANFKYPMFFDKGVEFKDLNNLSNKKLYQTFLLKGKKIVYTGSPMKGDLFKQEFLKLIK